MVLREIVLERAPGARTRWRVVLVVRGVEVFATTGRGPLGRLRARSRAERWARERGVSIGRVEDVAEDAPPWPRSRMLAVSRCLNRLRFQGII